MTSPVRGERSVIIAEVLTPQVAQKILDLRPAPEVLERVAQLAEKSNESTLTEAERGSDMVAKLALVELRRQFEFDQELAGNDGIWIRIDHGLYS